MSPSRYIYVAARRSWLDVSEGRFAMNESSRCRFIDRPACRLGGRQRRSVQWSGACRRSDSRRGRRLPRPLGAARHAYPSRFRGGIARDRRNGRGHRPAARTRTDLFRSQLERRRGAGEPRVRTLVEIVELRDARTIGRPRRQGCSIARSRKDRAAAALLFRLGCRRAQPSLRAKRSSPD